MKYFSYRKHLGSATLAILGLILGIPFIAPSVAHAVSLLQSPDGTSFVLDEAYASNGVTMLNKTSPTTWNGSLDLSSYAWFTPVNGAHYYVSIPHPTTVLCSEIDFQMYRQISTGSFGAQGSPATGVASGSNCHFDIVAGGTSPIVFFQFFQNTGSALSFTMSGNGTSSVSSYDIFSGALISNGVPAFSLSDSTYAPFLSSDTNYLITTAPVDTATNVDTNVAFFGNYSNDGDFDSIAIILNDDTNETSVSVPCGTAFSGYNLVFQCTQPVSASASFTYYAKMYKSVNGLAYVGTEGVDFITSTPYSFDTGTTTTPVTTYGTYTCETFDITCYLVNFATWAFIPTPASLSQFSDLTLEDKFPFSYLYDMSDVFSELFANTGSMSYSVSVNTGSLGTISLISASQINAVPYASTIKTLLGYILYVMTAMTLYHMLLRTHSTTHQ